VSLRADYFGGHWWAEGDRLTPFLIAAAAFHLLVLFLVGFAWSSQEEEPPPPAFDVTLVNTRSQTVPEVTDYLAQADQEGGGNTDERVRPTTMTPAAMPQARPVESAVAPPSDPVSPQRAADEALLLSERAEAVIETDDEEGERREEAQVARILSRSREIASLEMELGQAIQAYAKQPRERFVTASTKEFRYAAYLDAWRRKVERIGNLNYPEEARRRGLSGSLILDVALNPDGSIHEITVVRSSGHPVLDQAAMRIVRMAAPFAPFPASIRKDTDILHITRTWRFLSGKAFTTQ